MAATIELQEGESVEKEFSGDYWNKTLFTYSQVRGRYWITNKRIVFRGGFATELNLSYAEIDSVQTCNVGPLLQFLPTGIKVNMRDGKAYKLSVLKRKSIIELIESKLH